MACLCAGAHDRIDNGDWSNAIMDLPGGIREYRIWDIHNRTILERVLSRGGKSPEVLDDSAVELPTPAQGLPTGAYHEIVPGPDNWVYALYFADDHTYLLAGQMIPNAAGQITLNGITWHTLAKELGRYGRLEILDTKVRMMNLATGKLITWPAPTDPHHLRAGAPAQPVQAEGGALGRGGDALSGEPLIHLPSVATTQAIAAPAEGFAVTQGALTFDRWVEEGRSLGCAERDMPWAVGDWVIVGEESFGEEHAQALDVLGLGLKAINNRAWVARCFPPSGRVPELSWSHHRLLAKDDYTDEERRHWLMRARDEGLTVRELRELIMGPPEPKQGRCPACGHTALRSEFNA